MESKMETEARVEWNPRAPYSSWNRKRWRQVPPMTVEEIEMLFGKIRATVDVPSGLSPDELEKFVHK